VSFWSRLFFLLVIAGPFAPARVHARDILFDDLGGTGVRAVQADRYAADGLRLETNGAGLFVFGPTTFAASPPDWLYGSQTAAGGNADANVTLRFFSPTDGSAAVTDDVAFTIADGDHIGAWNVRGFNVDNQPVALVTGTGATRVRLTGKPFHSVVFTPSADFDGIDSLAYGDLESPNAIIAATPIAFGHAWRYLHPINGVDPATTDADFHSTWFRNDESYNGRAFSAPSRSPLGYGDITLRAPVTNIGTPPSGQRYSAYFTTTFEVPDAFLLRTASLDLLADDGAFIYLNGRLVARHNIGATAADTYRQAALATTVDGIDTEVATFSLNLDPAALVTGTNFLAVSLHNQLPSSSDLAFDLQLSLTAIPAPNSGVLALLTAVGLVVRLTWKLRRSRPAVVCFAFATWLAISATPATAQTTAIVASSFHLLNSRPQMTVPDAPASGNFSGVAFHPATESLFVVDNGVSYIYEFDLTGAHRRTITTTGFDDTEGIAWLGGNQFVLLEEKTTHLNRITIDPATTTIDKTSLPPADIIRPDLMPADPSRGALNPTGGNTGLEGVAYDPTRNVYYVVKEKAVGTPGDYSVNIFEVASDGAARVLFNPSVPHGAATASLTSLATDVADVVYDPRTDHLLILSQESRRMIEVTLAGEVVGVRFQRGTQVEGITLTPDADELYVVGESREFFHYQASPDLAALIPPGARWKYRDNGSNPGIEWRTASFDDAAWPEGPAELGYGDADEATTVDCGPTAACNSLNHATTYFRHSFNVPVASAVDELFLGIQRDDAAAVYLNGVEIYRDTTLPADPAFNQFATGGVALADPVEDFFVHLPVDPELLISGRNTLAIEVHQIAPTDLDLSFNAQLIARFHPIPEPATLWLALAILTLLAMPTVFASYPRFALEDQPPSPRPCRCRRGDR
jgi:uncharacterized protein YjiK